MTPDRPKFFPSLFGVLKKETEDRGLLSLFPAWLILSFVVGSLAALFFPDSFWTDEKWDISTALYAGLLTFTGLILAFGWSAYSRIYDTLLRGDFGVYLAKVDFLNEYIFQITWMHTIKTISATMALVGLVFVFFDFAPAWVDRSILAINISLIIYSIKQGSDAVCLMNDIVWQANYFEINKPQLSAKVERLEKKTGRPA